MAFYTYLLRCRDGSYYAGHTDDIDVRLAQHQQGVLGGYTARGRTGRSADATVAPEPSTSSG